MITEFLAKLPSTNARIFVTLLIYAATSVVFLYLMAIGQLGGIDESMFVTWLTFLSFWAGLDVAQFHLKRKTHMEAPPTQPDVEDAPAQELAAKKGPAPLEPDA